MRKHVHILVILFVAGIIYLGEAPEPGMMEIDTAYYAKHSTEHKHACHDNFEWNCVHVHIMKEGCPDDCNFDPQYVRVRRGTKVEWGNHDDELRRIVELGGDFDSGRLEQVKQVSPDPLGYQGGYWPNYDASHFSHVFHKPGIYTYVDTYSGIRGYVEVH